MKRTKIIYWIFTGVLAAFIGLSGIPDLMGTADALKIICTQLHYPDYFMHFLGFAKIVGAIAIIIPRFPRIKEWAYAGIAFDLIAAAYSQLATGVPFGRVCFMILFFVLFIVSYVYYHKRQKIETAGK